MALSREDMRRIALDEYFGVVSAGTIDETLAFFCKDATFTLYPSGRIFEGYVGIAEMYHTVFARHRDIEREVLDCCFDERAGTMAASFKATVRSPREPDRQMYNVNFWRFRGDKFAEVKVFTSDSEL